MKICLAPEHKLDRRDKLAMSASDNDILRHRVQYVTPSNFMRFTYSIEEARYRYADAMIAASNQTQ